MFLHICSKEVAPKKLDRFTMENEDVNIKRKLFGGENMYDYSGNFTNSTFMSQIYEVKNFVISFNLGNDIYSKIKTRKFIMIKICIINL